MSADLPTQRDTLSPPNLEAARGETQDTVLLAPVDLHDLLQRLSVHAGRPEGEPVLGLDHLCAALAYVRPASPDVERSIVRVLQERTAPSAATAQQCRALHRQALRHPLLPYDAALEAWVQLAYKRYPQGFLAWRHNAAVTGHNWFELLVQAMQRQVPGQDHAAESLARHLALQLADRDRAGAAHALLVGPPGCGHRQAARAVAQTLAASGGYAVFEFDMSVIRNEGEVTELDGGKPQWTGARPGRLTGALHKNPRTVVVLHDADQAVAGAQRTLLTALQEGYMVDQYGLEDTGTGQRRFEGREPTRVNLREAVLIFTATSGQGFWQHPDMAELLNGRSSDWRDAHHCALAGLRSFQREHRGEAIPAFHPQVLDVLEPQAVVFRPPSWVDLRAAAERAVLEACRQVAARLHMPVLIEPGVSGGLADVALTWLAGLGSQAGLEQLSPSHATSSLLTALVQAVMAGSADDLQPQEARVQLPATEVQALHALLSALGGDPLRQMTRRRCRLRFDVQVHTQPATAGQPAQWLVQPTGVRWEKTKDFADYSGSTALAAVVPDVSFDQIAGHNSVKAELRNIIRLYKRADELRHRGLELPRGAVLHGPPGTGKTMLAQATAAEADMAFIPTTGADLLDVATVQRVFSLAQRNAPAMVFIDEIDALGKRGQTGSVFDTAINRVLTAIQGFDQRAPVFVLAATNRLHLLDDALVRPGRLDKKLYVGPLDRAGREPLLHRVMAHLPPESRNDTSLQRLLSFSDGMTGADLGEVLREASLRTLDSEEAAAGPSHLSLEQTLELIITRKLGERSRQQCDPAFRELIAHHEAGHALVLAMLRPDLTIQQVSIVGREHTQGHLALTAEDSPQREATADSRLKEMAIALGGREAERLRYPDTGPSEGGAQDLVRARVIAFMSVAHRGLDEGPDGFATFTVLRADDEDRSLWPEQVKQHLWQRVRVWMQRAQDLAHQTLLNHWPVVQQITQELLASDVLPGERIQAILAEHRLHH